MNPLDLERLAVRIETLQNTRTHGWNPADEMEFKRLLPGSRDRRALPNPDDLRNIARQLRARQEPEDFSTIRRDYRMWLQVAFNAEGIARDNHPRNPKRIMRDMARGRFPKFGSLRRAVIKLAHENPELRSHLLPLVTAKDKPKTPQLRDPYYKMSDGLVAFEEAIGGKDLRGDRKLRSLFVKLDRAKAELHKYLNANYTWD